MFKKSRCGSRSLATSTASSVRIPPSYSSSALIRMPIGKSGPTTERIAAMSSIQKRTRFSSDPPYSSVRRLIEADRNWAGR